MNAIKMLNSYLKIRENDADYCEVTPQWHSPNGGEVVCLTLGHLRSLAQSVAALRAEAEPVARRNYGALPPPGLEWQTGKTPAEILAGNTGPCAEPVAKPLNETLWGTIAAVYGDFDEEDCALIDRTWAKQRGLKIAPPVPASVREALANAFLLGRGMLQSTINDVREYHGETWQDALDEVSALSSPPEPTLRPSGEGEWITDQELRRRWREAGGEFYGPRIETGSMPEAKLLPFLRSLFRTTPQAAPEPTREEIASQAQFLLDRLDEFDPGEADAERDYHGHGVPAIARLRAALTKPRSEARDGDDAAQGERG